jgi:small subunit ribosomal protein S2
MDSSNNWLLFLLILLIIVILVWALLRNRPKQSDLPAPHESGHVETEVNVEKPPEVTSKTVGAETIPETASEKDMTKAVQVEIPDDLEIIEGIGPRIAQLLREAGITTFAQLADADIANLKSILLRAKLRVNDPNSWPAQAKLAAAGKYDELKRLQDTLKGGRA